MSYITGHLQKSYYRGGVGAEAGGEAGGEVGGGRGEDEAVEALQRLQTLQRVCATLSLDGILFVGGVDGKHHEASHEVLAWLLNGESGRVVFGRGSGGVDMEEVVLVITPTAARLYCPAAIWQALAPRLGLWPRDVAPPPAPPGRLQRVARSRCRAHSRRPATARPCAAG